MKPGQGKNKGSSFERLICKKLTRWVTGKEDPLIFWRTASSGAHATQKAKANKASKMYGDIMAIAKEGEFLTDRFVIECKHYKDYNFEDFVLYSKGLVMDWWNQVKNDTEKAGKHPLLIYKRNNYSILVMFFESDMKGNFGTVITPNICVYPLDTYLALIKPGDFK